MISEPLVISGESITGAWRAATKLLIDEGDRFNVVVHVKEPATYDEHEIKLLDPRSINRKITGVFDVANTIFPRGRGHEADSASHFCIHYNDVFERGHSHKPTAWGTYFQRLVA